MIFSGLIALVLLFAIWAWCAIAKRKRRVVEGEPRDPVAQRVRVHLIAPHPAAELPTIEGLLLAREPVYRLALPSLLVAAGANPTQLESREIGIEPDRVAFYEVIQ